MISRRSVVRDAEDLREHLHRDLGGDLAHEVELALGQREVQDLAGDASHLVLPHPDRPRGEPPGDQAAQLIVARGVHVDHRLARLDLLGVEVLQGGAADLRGIGVDVAVDDADVLVAGHRPEAGTAVGLGVPVDGVLGSQLRERRVGHGLEERVVVGEVDEGRLGHVALRGGGCTRRCPSPRPTRGGAGPRSRLIGEERVHDRPAERVGEDRVLLQRVERGLERRGQRVARDLRIGVIGVAEYRRRRSELRGGCRRRPPRASPRSPGTGWRRRRRRAARSGCAAPRSGGMRISVERLS